MKKKETFLLTPLRATEALQMIGEDYDRKRASLYYGAVLLVAIVFGLLFELKLVFLLIVVVTYILCVPQLVYNQKKSAYEVQRFNDINSYMSQMAQSFIYTKDVIKSLEETATCFTSGHMHDTLMNAVQIIENGRSDIKQAEREALFYIESRYDCEKARNLHSFFLNAEELGGECTKEFKILESMRTAWQSVVEGIRLKKFWDRNISAIIYAFFLLICIIMLHIMRDANLNIVSFLPTQIIDTALLVGFIIFFVFMDNRLTKSLLINATVMSEKRAQAHFDYLESYDSKTEQKKYLSFSILTLVASAVFFYIKPSLATLAVCICLVFVGFNIHTIIHVKAVRTIKTEIEKAFPKWLFDVMLLLQRESVEGAIEKSIETAPPILKRDLKRIVAMLSVKPHDPDAYMSFLRDYNIQSVNEIMHKLYSLAVGANRDSEVLEVVMEKNIKNLEKAERDSLMLKDSMKSFTWIPFLAAGFGCIGYLVIAIMTSVSSIIDLIA